MSQQQLKVEGSITAQNPVGSPPGQPTTLVKLDDSVFLKKVLSTSYSLLSDSPVSVDLGNLEEVNFLSIRAEGGYVRLRITTTMGTTQAVPVDPSLILRSDDVGITAIELTRESTVDTEVYIVLGEKA